MTNDGGDRAILAAVIGGLLAFVVLVFAFGWGGNDATHTASLNTPNISHTR